MPKNQRELALHRLHAQRQQLQREVARVHGQISRAEQAMANLKNQIQAHTRSRRRAA